MWAEGSERAINIKGTTDFILNRLDNVAMWVIEWMPPEDNLMHHNAVEHLLRIRQEVLRIVALLEPNYRPEHIDEDLALYTPIAELPPEETKWAREFVRRVVAKRKAEQQ